MLSEECKERLFNTQDLFEINYININFATYKEINVQAWSTEKDKVTYIVRFSEDMLSSGTKGKIIEEYYTFIRQDDGSYKININNYIYGKKTNKEVTEEDITLKILNCNIYKDYEEYEIQLINKKSEKILIKNYIDNIYLVDNQSVKYSILDEKIIERDINRKAGASEKSDTDYD